MKDHVFLQSVWTHASSLKLDIREWDVSHKLGIELWNIKLDGSRWDTDG